MKEYEWEKYKKYFKGKQEGKKLAWIKWMLNIERNKEEAILNRFSKIAQKLINVLKDSNKIKKII